MDSLDTMLKESDAYLGGLGKLSLAESKAAREVNAAKAKIDQWRQTRDWETRTPDGRREYEDVVLADGMAAEKEADEAVQAARALAERLADAGHEPGGARYGEPGFGQDVEKYGANEARFVSSYVVLSDSALDTFNRVSLLITEEVDSATTSATLERMLDAATGDKGRLFATCRAIERRNARRENGPTSERIRQALDAAWETLRDPRRAKLREQAKALSTKAADTRRAVWSLRRDELAREAARAGMSAGF